jgi:hypothetical protein
VSALRAQDECFASLTGSFIVSVVQTPSGLAFIGSAQIGESSSAPIVWLEP